MSSVRMRVAKSDDGHPDGVPGRPWSWAKSVGKRLGRREAASIEVSKAGVRGEEEDFDMVESHHGRPHVDAEFRRKALEQLRELQEALGRHVSRNSPGSR